MRLSIEIAVSGSTVAEIVDLAVNEWNSMMGTADRLLPQGCEIEISPLEEISDSEHSKKYAARVIIRTKVEDHE